MIKYDVSEIMSKKDIDTILTQAISACARFELSLMMTTKGIASAARSAGIPIDEFESMTKELDKKVGVEHLITAEDYSWRASMQREDIIADLIILKKCLNTIHFALIECIAWSKGAGMDFDEFEDFIGRTGKKAIKKQLTQQDIAAVMALAHSGAMEPLDEDDTCPTPLN